MKISPRQPPKKTRCGDKSFKLTLACCLAILLIAVFGGIGTLIAVLKEAPARIQRIPHGELDTLLLVAGGVPFRHEGQMELVFVGPAPPHGRNGGPGGGENNTSSSLPGRNSSEAAGVECPIGNMQVFPGFLQNAKLGFSNGIPLMCGGKKTEGNDPFVKKCVKYDPIANRWRDAFKTGWERYDYAVVQLNATEFWLAGGGPISEVTWICSDRSCRRGPDIPVQYQTSYPCATLIDDESIVWASVARRFAIFNWKKKQWTPLPDMPSDRFFKACGLLRHPNGSKELLVTGDIGLVSTDIFNFETQSWRQGGDLPDGRSNSRSSLVQYGSSVLLIGGECVECTQPPPKKANAIYEYNVAEDEWMVREEKTTVTVFNSGASLVDGGLYGCKKKKEEKKKDGKKEKKRKETKPN